MKNSIYNALTVDEEILKIVNKFIRKDKEGDLKARKSAMKDLSNYLIKTDDGSYTLRSGTIAGKSENMHTSQGAITEALEKFVKPARLKGKEKVRVLDICSGLGYNAASCIEFLNDDTEIELDLVEISKETLALTLLMDTTLESHNNSLKSNDKPPKSNDKPPQSHDKPPKSHDKPPKSHDKPPKSHTTLLKSYKIICKAVEDELYAQGDIKFRNYTDEIPERINIKIHLGDAREVVKELHGKNKYDAIFLDPFSPLKSPELYTLEFLKILKNLLTEDGVILTYTSAAPVRAGMVINGLYVGEGPSLGRSGGTIASLKPDMIRDQISMEDERMIALSDAGIPFKDPELKGTSPIILQRRKMEREAVRGNSKFPSTVKTPIYLNRNLDEGRLKRRVLKNVKRLGLENLTSPESLYITCPQYKDCICGRGCKNYHNSTERINQMNQRLKVVLNNIETKHY